MKKWYLLLSIAGFIAPNILVTKVGLETGNLLLYANPLMTIQQMFANDIASVFAIDLLFVVMIFMLWSFHEAKQLGMKTPWVIWVLTMLFGLAGAFPLFLYQRENRKA